MTDQSKLLPIHHIAEATREALEVIENRRKGIDRPLKTRHPKLNAKLLGGINFDSNLVLAGLSGSGKSALANEIQKELIELNPDVNFDILFFSFEMNSYQNIIRSLSTDLRQEYSTLISVESQLNEAILNKAKEYAAKYSEYPIYYCQTTGNVEQIYRTILNFQDEQRRKHNDPNRGLIYIIDHTTLVANGGGESEFNMLTRLSNMAINIKLLKRKIGSIYLSQLNSDIETDNRITKPTLHIPRRSDLFNAKAVFNMADTVIVSHRPENLGIEFYTTEKFPTEGKMWLHFIKSRLSKGNMAIAYDVDFRYNLLKEEETKGFVGKFKF